MRLRNRHREYVERTARALIDEMERAHQFQTALRRVHGRVQKALEGLASDRDLARAALDADLIAQDALARVNGRR